LNIPQVVCLALVQRNWARYLRTRFIFRCRFRSAPTLPASSQSAHGCWPGDIRSAYTVCWSVKFNRRRRIRRRLLNENADADEAREGEKKREKQDRRKEGTRRVRTNLTATRLLHTKDEEIYLNEESKNALPPAESRTRRPRGEGQ